MADPFTIRIFVPDGDTQGVRIIDRMNWTGLGFVCPRDKWLENRSRSEFSGIGVYILVGYKNEDDELPTIYIGQADGLRSRMELHFQKKEFWDWCAIFVSTNNSLNRGHVTWLEYGLIQRALKAARSHLDNGNTPQEPALSAAEKADTKSFLKEILQILPLVGLHAFEIPKPVAVPQASTATVDMPARRTERDTIIVPARKDGFDRVFLGQNCWYAIRISGGMLQKIRYIAAYQSQPISAITHFAPVERIEPYGEEGKYKVIFSEKAQAIGPIEYGNAPSGAMQGPRYTTVGRLKSAKTLADLL
jgi:hypothetical protein